jgi:polyferredoxin
MLDLDIVIRFIRWREIHITSSQQTLLYRWTIRTPNKVRFLVMTQIWSNVIVWRSTCFISLAMMIESHFCFFDWLLLGIDIRQRQEDLLSLLILLFLLILIFLRDLCNSPTWCAILSPSRLTCLRTPWFT